MFAKLFFIENNKAPWLALYILSNVIAAFVIIRDGYHIGDALDIPLHDFGVLIFSLISLLFSYYFIMVPLFNIMASIKISSIKFRSNNNSIGFKIGVVLIVLQSLFFYFNISNGVNIAGSGQVAKTQSIFSIFWVLMPVDMLFIVYYSYYRAERLWGINLAIWIFSQISRGWVGGLMTIVFLEFSKRIRDGKINFKKFLFYGTVLFLIYPLVTQLKWIIRANSGDFLNLEIIINSLDSIFGLFNFFDILWGGVEHFVSRIQLLSLTTEVIRLGDVLQRAFDAGEFSPFWLEGIHGIIYDNLFIGGKRNLITVAFTQYENFPGRIFEIGSYNVSLGYLSWFFISPVYSFFYFIYTLLMMFLSFYFFRKAGDSKLSIDLLWFYWLTLLMAGWLFVFITLIHTLIVFIFLKYILSRKLAIRWAY